MVELLDDPDVQTILDTRERSLEADSSSLSVAIPAPPGSHSAPPARKSVAGSMPGADRPGVAFAAMIGVSNIGITPCRRPSPSDGG